MVHSFGKGLERTTASAVPAAEPATDIAALEVGDARSGLEPTGV
jgi:hypothetical protein